MRNDIIYEYIGSTIKKRRKSLGFTQEELASRLSMSRASLASIETGRQNVLVHQLYSFASALELSVNDFLVSIEKTITISSKVSEVPLPANLTAVQKEQLARFIDN